MDTGASDFIVSTTIDYRSTGAAESCSCLAVLQSIDYFISELNESSKIDVRGNRLSGCGRKVAKASHSN